jgi:phospholipid/cholesterol/gamma-HCH transport system substrate-binding protein
MHRNVIETVMGAVVLAVAIVFLAFAYSGANVGSASGYELTAKFDRIDGVTAGTDVRISGVKVGAVSSITLDTQSYMAVMHLVVDPSVQLPADTVAIVSSDGLLGGKTVALSPGGDSEMLKPGDTIQYTQSTPSLEQLLGQVIFSLQNAGSSSDKGEAPAGGSGAPGGLLTDN